MSLTIRKATSEDLKIIHDLAEDIWWPTYGQILEAGQIRFMLDTMYSIEALSEQQENGVIFLLAERDEESVAFAGYAAAPAEGKLSIHKLYVHPAEQGRGTGRTLIHYIEQVAQSMGINTLELNVNRNNKALQFYQRVGFEIFREEDIPYYQYWMNDFILRKYLK